MAVTTTMTTMIPFLTLSNFPRTSLTKPQLSKVSTADLLPDSEVRADHHHCLAGNTGPLTGTVGGPFARTADSRDLACRLRTHLLRLPNLFGAPSRLCRHLAQAAGRTSKNPLTILPNSAVPKAVNILHAAMANTLREAHLLTDNFIHCTGTIKWVLRLGHSERNYDPMTSCTDEKQ